MPQTWKELLQKKISRSLGEKYLNAFPVGYRDDNSVAQAVQDIQFIENLSAENPLEINFHYVIENEQPNLYLRLFQWEKPMALSDVLPMLENMDLRTFNERPYQIVLPDNNSVWISDFSVAYKKPEKLDIEPVAELFRDAFTQIYLGVAENDGFNRLVLGAGLSWREITVLRAYTKFLRQVGFRFSQAYIETTLAAHHDITTQLVQLFLLQHNPAQKSAVKKQAEQIEKQILLALEKVTSLDEDRILRRMLDLIKATLRTNYFQTLPDGKPKSYLSLKFNSRAIPEMPLPIPLYEIFVYAPRFEAIHLRNTKVARGGIRWSDRREDFRTEILGLMKAQKVKNAVIVPSGSKGGFVLKSAGAHASREEINKEVIACYKAFISGLLDLTDNIKDNKIIRPPNVVCYDNDDTYLVVAADKGTASFSDIANNISKEYDFWLGDAFASGGSKGYDHKKIGITARGAWESINRHFRDLNVDLHQEIITVVGIGDMSGDVFGNGMIYTKNIKLLAAFDHRHIFIDPNPNPELSYQERLRLFKLPTSSWENYNPKLISEGGGVYARTLKSINLSAEAKSALGIEVNSLTPVELIRAILKAPVDLLFNGGIGTYVKATTESNADVGDRANDFCRVEGSDLRCTVVGEGGNLGFTQLGRVEYAMTGGHIYTDFIDNSAGVDCSDHEVNLKILLDQQVNTGKLTEKKRNEILVSVTNEVADLVLHDNYQQALVMSYSTFHSQQYLGLHQAYIKDLEHVGGLDRHVEFLPDDKKLLERKAAGLGLTPPEIAVLLSYTKIYIKNEILKSDVPEEPYFSQYIETAFPTSLRKNFKNAMLEHKLRRDIIATQLSNLVVNEIGITFFYRLQTETGATIAEILRAQTVASQVFNIRELQALIESLGFKIPIVTQYEMRHQIRNLVNLATRWFLHGDRLQAGVAELIKYYQPRLQQLRNIVPELMVGITRSYLDSLVEQFMKIGLSRDDARHIAVYRAMYTALNAIEVAEHNNFDLINATKVYFAVGDKFNLVWFRDQIGTDTREGHWNAMARLTLRDELDVIQRTLTKVIINQDKKQREAIALIDKWIVDNFRVMERWENVLNKLHGSTNVDYTMFFIALRELLGLI